MKGSFKRIIVGLLLIFTVGITVYLGKNYLLILVAIAGSILIDEIIHNFLRKKRVSFTYPIAQLLYLVPVIYLNFFNISHDIHIVFVYSALAVNLISLLYLFVVPMNKITYLKIAKKISWTTAIPVICLIMCFSYILHEEKWMHMVLLVLLICVGMDTGAWFFGKLFGKNKLWVTVSPNKTIEGLIGGMFLSGVAGGIYAYFIFDITNVFLLSIIPFFGLLSHLGDLFQSKIKRQCDLKNSSSLLPGHGGVYDRLDSVIFLCPFYILIFSICGIL